MEGLNNLIKGKLLSDIKISEESLLTWMSAILTMRLDFSKTSLKTAINHLIEIFCLHIEKCDNETGNWHPNGN